ncbi:photosynthetic complex putative assembly protein PuhB [Novosphingobium sp. Gsoil 351]|uniref:photosynthetic complex putative assembly protein PuhB n=1 Tax=Novosphingobium sp. Gsoil 351 TaxID=2675225 RepID=UPI0012B4A997|nr:photosynthetic complex putative assembly protein PuhB [Novosphingobium sp. Gsoil 351]QGN54598.1 PH domain-containing protein [Novosphingobium sp. Gsoil 351]
MSEYDHEPVRGLPGNLPPGETIVWQGAPDWRVLARSALHTRLIAAYFAVCLTLALVNGSMLGVAFTVIGGALVVALLTGFAWAVARTTVYTLTNRRIVLRIGVALNTCINLPLGLIGSADLRERGHGFGDIALAPTASHRLGYVLLWPHARPFRLRSPQPMLRAVPDAAMVAQQLARACAALRPVEQMEVEATARQSRPALASAGLVEAAA